MSVTQKPLPGADSKHVLAISYPLGKEMTLLFIWLDKTHETNHMNQRKQTNEMNQIGKP